ncbi:MAG TPA: cytochrome C oxidase subunit IV family protein [Tepidisphaeraceae bacterium]|jgi:cytochrome c oxidase subunit 4|nr:cytochrome C oxidase subunit IV family protein [Tepidisphaeraceae bacterium]
MSSVPAHDSPNIRKYAAPDAHPVDMHERHGAGTAHVHVTPPALLLGVYAVLVGLTILTVAITLVELGDFNVWAALAIAVLKAGLVAFYFMHLRWDSPFNGIVLMISLFFVALFIGISVLDTKEYQKNYIVPGSSAVSQ